MRLAACKRGATALEFALIAPPLLMLLLGTVDLGRLLWARAALNAAVVQAARCIAVTPELCHDARSAAGFARSGPSTATASAAHFSLGRNACGIEVRAQLQFRSILPFAAPFAPRLSASACIP